MHGDVGRQAGEQGQRGDVVAQLAVVVVLDEQQALVAGAAASAVRRATGRRAPSGYWCAGVRYTASTPAGRSVDAQALVVDPTPTTSAPASRSTAIARR